MKNLSLVTSILVYMSMYVFVAAFVIWVSCDGGVPTSPFGMVMSTMVLIFAISVGVIIFRKSIGNDVVTDYVFGFSSIEEAEQFIYHWGGTWKLLTQEELKKVEKHYAKPCIV